MAGELAAGLRAGRAFVDILPRLAPGAAAATEAQLGGMFSGLGGKAKLAGAAIGVGLAAGAIGIGVAAFKIGESFDSAFDTIRIGTGKTGAALDGLQGSFKNVLRAVPDDMGRVSTAISELNQRTGLTGPALEGLSTQVLTLSRLTGDDLSTTIEKSTRLFGDWGISVDKQAGTLDYLFRVSQATGIGVDDLSGKLVQFGAPLRELGFSMEQSAGLLGKFEEEGVNSELVMGSLRIALGKMAKAGEPAVETLARTVDEIKNAGSASEANAIALELFGARAGPDMAAAIREGRFEVSDLVDTLSSGGDTIMGVAGQTDDVAESFKRLKNILLVAVEPIATKVFDAFGKLAGIATQVISVLFAGDFTGGPFQEDSPFIAGVFKVRDVFLNDILPVLKRVGEFLSANLKPILIGLGAAFLAITSPVSLVVAVLVWLYAHFEGIRDVVNAVVGFLLTVVVPAIIAFAGYVAEQFGHLVEWVREHWDAISEAIGHVVAVISAIISAFVEVVMFIWDHFGQTILSVIRAVWENIIAVIRFAVDLVSGIIKFVLAIINGDWGAAWDAIVGILRGAWELVKTVLGNALEIVKSLVSDAFNGVKNFISGALDDIVGFFTGLPGRLRDVAGDVFGFLKEAFRKAVNFIIRGWNALQFKIPGFDPPGPGPKFGGFTLGLPHIDELALGGDITRAGLAIVGEKGPELVDLDAGARVLPLDVAAMLAKAAGSGGDGRKYEVHNTFERAGEVDPLLLARQLAWVLP
jgi:phage-related minor tail protein